MPTLTQIYTYPIKACGALTHDQIEIDVRGPLWDRRWMLIDAANVFLTQREFHALALVQPAFEADHLRIDAPNMPSLRISLEHQPFICRRVKIWKDTCKACDEGDQAAEWFSDYLHSDVRLVRMMEGFVRPVNPHYAPQPAQTAFSDGYPLLVVSEASLDDLNRRIVERGGDPVPMRRFRPNLVFSGCDAFAEDIWKTVQIGDVTIDIVKPCARCEVTAIDPATGTAPDPKEPLATLNTFRNLNGKVMFAQNAIHRAPGKIAVGDEVSVIA